PNMHVEYVRVEPPGIPIAFWRSVGPSHNVFVTESFIDELAATAKQDPVAYRLALLDKTPRAKAVLALAAEKAGGSGERRSGPRPARGLRSRLRHRRQSRHGPGADPERDHLRHHGRALWHHHSQGRPCRANQLRYVPSPTHERGARHRGPHRSER